MKAIKLLFIGLITLLPTTGLAADPDPISEHYVKPMLERADQAISAAQSGDSADLFGFIMSDWMWQIASAFTQLSDTKVKIIERERGLHQVTACLEYDLILIQKKMKKVRDVIKKEIKKERVTNIGTLQSIIHYLNDRQRHILQGATDNNYEDPAVAWRHSFDAEAWCCPNSDIEQACVLQNGTDCAKAGGRNFRSWQECSQTCQRPNVGPDVKQCPFDSDYLPPSPSGYGCHLNVLERIDTSIQASLAAELASARALDEEQQEFLREAQRLQDLANELAQLTEGGSDGPPLIEPFEYKRRVSCNYQDSPNPESPENEDNTTDDSPTEWPTGAIAFEKRGSFNILPNTFRQLQNFDQYLTTEAKRREQGERFKLPEEYPPGPERDAAQDREVNELNIIQKIIRYFVREESTKQNIIQSREAAKILVESHDANQALATTFRPLRQAVQRFGELASLPDQGARLFMVNYGSFLQKSCLYRPCQGLLQRLLEVSMSDKCFPYTDGTYLDNPKHYEDCSDGLTK